MKSILFIYGKLLHLNEILNNFPLKHITDSLDVDIFVYGEINEINTSKEIENIIINHFSIIPHVLLDDNSHIETKTLVMFKRLNYISKTLTEGGYDEKTPILIIRGDMCYDIINEETIRNELFAGTDEFFCVNTDNNTADDQIWLLNLKTLTEYLLFCLNEGFVTHYFDTHVALAKFLNITNKYKKIICDKIIVRDNCKDFSSMYSIQDAAKIYWEEKTKSPFCEIEFIRQKR